MPEPVLIIHGVANHESGPFYKSVEELQLKISSQWQLVPIFWGDLGGAAVDIDDCLPVLSSAGWTTRSAGFEETLPTPIRGDLGSGRLTNEERASIVFPGQDEFGFRSSEGDLRTELKDALDKTRILQHIDDDEVLASLRETIHAAVEPSSGEEESEFGVRGPEAFATRGPISGAIGRIVKGIDDMLGKMLGNNLGVLNQKLRNALADPFSRFFGDILVYQANKEKILGRVWDVLEEKAPGSGKAGKPINAIAHSLGGLIVFDGLLREVNDPKRLHLKGFVTFGSQPALFHIIDPRVPPLTRYVHNQKVRLPDTVRKWTNLWDTMDLLAFTASTVFELHDGSSPTDIPVQDSLSLILDEKVWTHSIYWKTQELLNALELGLVPSCV